MRATVTASSGYGDVCEDCGDDGVGGDSLHLRFGAQLDAMAKRGECQGFHVIRNDVVAAGEPGPGSCGGQQRGSASGRDAEGERGGFTRGTTDIDDVSGDLGGDLGLGDCVAGGFQIGRAG